MGAGTPAAGSVGSRCPAVITIVQPVGLSVATPGMSSRWAGDFADLAVDRDGQCGRRSSAQHLRTHLSRDMLPNLPGDLSRRLRATDEQLRGHLRLLRHLRRILPRLLLRLLSAVGWRTLRRPRAEETACWVRDRMTSGI